MLDTQDEQHIRSLVNKRNALINSIKEALWSIDSNFTLVDANDTFYYLYSKLTKHDVKLGHSIIFRERPDDVNAEKWIQRYQRALNGETYSVESFIPIDNIGWVEITFNPIIEDNSITGVACFSRNINSYRIVLEKLKESEKNMAQAQRIASLGSWEIDLTTNITHWSEHDYSILGYEPYSVTPNFENFIARVHPNDVELITQTIQKALTQKSKFSIQHRVVWPNGEVRWLLSEGESDIDENTGKVLKIVGSNLDITERKTAEQQIANEKDKRDALINNIPDLMWSIDKEYRLIDANKAFYDALHYLSGKPIAPGDSVIYDNLDEPSIKQWLGLYNRALIGETFVEAIEIAAGNSGWAEATLSPIYENGEIVGAACYSKDINQRKVAEELIKQSEKNMAHAQRLAHVGSWDIELTGGNPFGKIAIWSDETYRILGYDKDTVTPSLQLFTDRLHPEDKEYVIGAISSGIANNDSSPIEYRVVWPDGTVRWLKSEGEVIQDSEGNAVRIVGTHQDITKSKKLQLEREKITQDLLQRNKELEQFAYIVSHNLRGPVSNIIGITEELLITPSTDEIYPEFLAGLKNSTDKLDGVIKDLGFILQRKREVTEQFEDINFSELVENIKGSISNMITESGANIQYQFEVPAMVSLKTYLYSIFYNLISNSIKYRATGVAPDIKITSTTHNGFIELVFTDNGIGIDLTKNADKVFGLYKRFHSHTEGKGMGLYMVKSQVESLGGTIGISSELNKGTTFAIRFKN